MKFKFFLTKYVFGKKIHLRGKFLNKQVIIAAADLVEARKQIYLNHCTAENGWQVSMFWPV